MRNYRNIALLILFGGISYSSFGGTIVILALREKISNPIYLSLAIISQKAIKIFLETPIGIFADKYGVKKIFTIVPILMLATIPLIMHNSLLTILLCAIIQGVSISLKSGKIEGSIYNSLQKEGKAKMFSKILAIYYVVSDLIVGGIGYFSSKIYQTIGTKGVFATTAVVAIISMAMVLMLNEKDLIDKKTAKASQILKDAFRFFKSDKRVIMCAVMLTMYNFFGWQFAHTQKIFFAEKGIPTHAIGGFYGITHILMSIGSVGAFFLAGSIRLITSMAIWVATICLMLAASLSGLHINFLGESFPIVVAPFLIYPIIYPLAQISVVKNIEDRIPTSQRMTITSFSNLLAVIANIVLSFSIGVIAKITGKYEIALNAIFATTIAIGLWQIASLYRGKRKPKK